MSSSQRCRDPCSAVSIRYACRIRQWGPHRKRIRISFSFSLFFLMMVRSPIVSGHGRARRATSALLFRVNLFVCLRSQSFPSITSTPGLILSFRPRFCSAHAVDRIPDENTSQWHPRTRLRRARKEMMINGRFWLMGHLDRPIQHHSTRLGTRQSRPSRMRPLLPPPKISQTSMIGRCDLLRLDLRRWRRRMMTTKGTQTMLMMALRALFKRSVFLSPRASRTELTFSLFSEACESSHHVE